jgi:hypothetical protein
MAELPLNQAVIRFQGNEDRIDQFVNDVGGAGTYTTSGGEQVKTLPALEAEIEASKLSLAAADGSSLVGHTKADGTTITTVEQALRDLEGAGGGNVDSVNGQTGVVVLSAADVGAAEAVHTHVASDVTDFSDAAAELIGSKVVAGTNVTVEYDALTKETKINAEMSVVRTPINVSPVNGSTNVSVTVTLEATSYANLYGVARQYREFQVDLIGGDFSSPVRSIQVDADSWMIDPAILDDTEFKWRCRDVDIEGNVSGWSNSWSFTTYDIYIETPAITKPTEGSEHPNENDPFTASAFVGVNTNETHAASYWVVRDSGGSIIHQSGRTTTDLTSYQAPLGVLVIGETVSVEVRYEGSGGRLSDWSSAVGFTVVGEPYSKFLAVSHSTTPFVTTYGQDIDAFAKLANPSALPPSTGRGVAFSADGVYMAITHDTSPFITIYKRSGNTFTKLANPSALPTGLGFGVAFSADGVYMAVGHTTSPFITIYKRSGDTFNKLANPSVLPTASGRGVAFSADGVYMAIAHDTSPFITIYKRSGDTFTKLANPSVLPTGNGNGVAFYPRAF